MGQTPTWRALTALDELTLIKRAQSGDLRAEEVLLARCDRWVGALVGGAGLGSTLRPEATQEAFLAVRRAIHRFDPARGARLITFATPHVVWSLQSLRLKVKRRRERDADLLARLAALPTPTGFSGATNSNWGHGWLAAAVASLPARHQRFLELQYWHGFERKEIAALYGVTPAAVTRQFDRIIGTLRAVAPVERAG